MCRDSRVFFFILLKDRAGWHKGVRRCGRGGTAKPPCWRRAGAVAGIPPATAGRSSGVSEPSLCEPSVACNKDRWTRSGVTRARTDSKPTNRFFACCSLHVFSSLWFAVRQSWGLINSFFFLVPGCHPSLGGQEVWKAFGPKISSKIDGTKIPFLKDSCICVSTYSTYICIHTHIYVCKNLWVSYFGCILFTIGMLC